jgi:hypothetical protein
MNHIDDHEPFEPFEPLDFYSFQKPIQIYDPFPESGDYFDYPEDLDYSDEYYYSNEYVSPQSTSLQDFQSTLIPNENYITRLNEQRRLNARRYARRYYRENRDRILRERRQKALTVGQFNNHYNK